MKVVQKPEFDHYERKICVICLKYVERYESGGFYANCYRCFENPLYSDIHDNCESSAGQYKQYCIKCTEDIIWFYPEMENEGNSIIREIYSDGSLYLWVKKCHN